MNTTQPTADEVDALCRPRMLVGMAFFIIYCLAIAYYMNDALKQRDKAIADLRLERIHCEWLQRRLRDNEYGDAPPMAVEHMVLPCGPAEFRA